MARNSKIILAKNIKLDRDYNNVLSYTEEQMVNLCRTNKIVEGTGFSFIRTNGNIKTPFTYEQCLEANYIAFQNPDYSNKWFFAWIDDVFFKADGFGEISFTIDSWSTWFNKLNVTESFIVREHVVDDTIGAHTIQENLDIGEVICEEEEEIFSPDTTQQTPSVLYIFETTFNPYAPPSTQNVSGVSKINNNLIGSVLLGFSSISYINNFLDYLAHESKLDSIKNVYILPYSLVAINGYQYRQIEYGIQDFEYYEISTSDEACYSDYMIEIVNNFQGLTIKNNKCFCYPYNYLLVSNNVGNYNIYKYENFLTEYHPEILDKPYFHLGLEMSITIGGSIRLVPKNYQNKENNYEESLSLAKFPTCSWSGDAFTNWLTQNAINLGTNIIETAGGVLTGNFTGVPSLIGQFREATLKPSIQGGNNTGDVNFSAGRNTFKIYKMRAKNEYIKIIDDYFTKYGYKINELKVPNIHTRQYFNYIQIADDFDLGYGEIPSKHLKVINDTAKKGVTIWHNHSKIGDYTVNNINI